MATIITPVRIGPADNGRRMAIAELQAAEVEEGYRYELDRGVLQVTEVPNDPHGVVVANLFDAISRYRRDHPRLIRRYGGGGEFRFWLPRMVSGRHPDLGVVLRGAPKDHRGRQFAAFAVEVVSASSVTRRLRNETRRVSRLWLARILDRRPPQTRGHRTDPSRRRLARKRFPRRPGDLQLGPARLRHDRRRALDRRRRDAG